MVAGELGLSLDQALAFEKRHGDALPGHLQAGPGLRAYRPQCSTTRSWPIVRVRQALLMALDREAISQQLFAGRQPVADSQSTRWTGCYTRRRPHYPYDPAAAAALLDEAGWTRASRRHARATQRASRCASS